jgi:hypothetical protein
LFSSGPAIKVTITTIACAETTEIQYNTIKFLSYKAEIKMELVVCVVLTKIIFHVSTERVVYCCILIKVLL